MNKLFYPLFLEFLTPHLPLFVHLSSQPITSSLSWVTWFELSLLVLMLEVLQGMTSQRCSVLTSRYCNICFLPLRTTMISSLYLQQFFFQLSLTCLFKNNVSLWNCSKLLTLHTPPLH